jgi:predicted site-specific integrase-resolvase
MNKKCLVEVVCSKELAEHFSVSVRTLNRWVASGEIPPPTKIGGRCFWRTLDIENLINSKFGGE